MWGCLGADRDAHGVPSLLSPTGSPPLRLPGPWARRGRDAGRAGRGCSSCQAGGLSVCRAPCARPGLCSPSPRAPCAVPRQQRVPKSAGAAVPPVGCFHDRFPYFINRDCTECKLVHFIKQPPRPEHGCYPLPPPCPQDRRGSPAADRSPSRARRDWAAGPRAASSPAVPPAAPPRAALGPPQGGREGRAGARPAPRAGLPALAGLRRGRRGAGLVPPAAARPLPLSGGQVPPAWGGGRPPHPCSLGSGHPAGGQSPGASLCANKHPAVGTQGLSLHGETCPPRPPSPGHRAALLLCGVGPASRDSGTWNGSGWARGRGL